MHSEGLVKNLGVSNFPCLLAHDLLSYAKVRPVVAQAELRLFHEFILKNCILNRSVQSTT
jgi:diketogulonate reductase-like aldo/keto reductase